MLMVLGWQSFNSLPVTRFPNIDIPVVAVTVAQPGAAPAEMESQITKKIEDAVAGLTGAALREVRFTFATPVPAAVFADLPGVREAVGAGTSVRCRFTGRVGALLRVAADHDPVSVTGAEPDLEDAFVDYVEGHGQHAR